MSDFFAAPVNTFNLLNSAANNSSNSHLALDPDVLNSLSLTLCEAEISLRTDSLCLLQPHFFQGSQCFPK